MGGRDEVISSSHSKPHAKHTHTQVKAQREGEDATRIAHTLTHTGRYPILHGAKQRPETSYIRCTERALSARMTRARD